MQLQQTPFVWVSFAMIVGVLGTALISPMYPLYQASWDLQTSDISFIYVIYMLGALCSLLFLGRLPDKIGFRRMMLSGLGLAVTGTTLTMLSNGMISLSIGRFIVGLASSIMTTSGSLGLAVLAHKDSKHRVGLAIGFLIAFGFGLGPLLGGIMAEWVPHPLITAHIPAIILGLVALYAMATLKTDSGLKDGHTPLKLHDCMPKLTWTDRAGSMSFALACGFPFLAFGMFGLYASMSPLFLAKMLTWHGPFVSGASIAVILLASAFVQLASARLPTRVSGVTGLLSLVVSSVFLIINLRIGSAILFAAGIALTAIGHGMCLLASMNVLNRLAQPHNRSGLLSTYLLIGYVGAILPVMGMGWIADIWGLDIAVSAFCTAVIVAGTVWTGAFALHSKRAAL